MNKDAARRSIHVETRGDHSPAAGRDYIGGNYTRIDANPIPSTGPGRFFSLVGIIKGLVGFASIGYVVLSFILLVFNSLATNRPPNIGSVPFVPFLTLGAALFLVGIAFVLIASVTGRAKGED